MIDSLSPGMQLISNPPELRFRQIAAKKRKLFANHCFNMTAALAVLFCYYFVYSVLKTHNQNCKP